jgi:CRP-like cAMP-binding protein
MRAGSLDGVAAFAAFPDTELRLLEALFVEERVAAGTVFFRQGELATASSCSLYLVVDGEVAVEREGGDGGGVGSPRRLGPGELFGVLGLATPIARTATCRAATHAVVGRLSRPAFDSLREYDTRLAARFELLLARQVVRDLRRLTVGLVGAMRTGYTSDFAAIVSRPGEDG